MWSWLLQYLVHRRPIKTHDICSNCLLEQRTLVERLKITQIFIHKHRKFIWKHVAKSEGKFQKQHKWKNKFWFISLIGLLVVWMTDFGIEKAAHGIGFDWTEFEESDKIELVSDLRSDFSRQCSCAQSFLKYSSERRFRVQDPWLQLCGKYKWWLTNALLTLAFFVEHDTAGKTCGMELYCTLI